MDANKQGGVLGGQQAMLNQMNAGMFAQPGQKDPSLQAQSNQQPNSLQKMQQQL